MKTLKKLPRPGNGKSRTTKPVPPVVAAPALRFDEANEYGYAIPTPADGLAAVRELGRRISGHVEFIRQIATQAGTSSEVRDRTTRAFLERLIVAERQLRKVREDFDLE